MPTGRWASPFLFNKVDAPSSSDNFNAEATSLADFSATVGYRFIQKERISYAAELKGLLFLQLRKWHHCPALYRRFQIISRQSDH